jgi:hypothetical protein
MNKGVRLASGDYIHIMNTDDFFLDLDYFRRSMVVLEKGEYDFTELAGRCSKLS